MAEKQSRNLNHLSSKGDQKQQRRPSRLQRRAPASIQVNPASSFASDWKVAIPLLSPLVLSPVSPPPNFGDHLTVENNTSSSSSSSTKQIITSTAEKPSFNMWQHPAGPFHYEPNATFVLPSFVPRCR